MLDMKEVMFFGKCSCQLPKVLLQWGFHYEETGLYVTFVAKHHGFFSTNGPNVCRGSDFFENHPIRVRLERFGR